MSALDTFEIDYSNGLPVWIQIKNRLSVLIASGEYSAGDRLPTVRALAIDLDISYNTVNRAYMDLEREGYISTRKGRGTFVSDIQGKNLSPLNDTVIMLADEMIKIGNQSGLDANDILALVKSRLNKE